MPNEQFTDAARRAVGQALLFRESDFGGSHGHGLDEQRCNKLAKEHLDGDQLYSLLLDVASRAVEGAAIESQMLRARVLGEVSRLAEQSDSLTLHRFIERVEAGE